MREESERAVDAGELAHCLMITSQIVHSTVDDVDVPLSSMFSLFCLYPTALLFRTAQLVTPVFGLSPELTPRALVFVHVRCLLPAADIHERGGAAFAITTSTHSTAQLLLSTTSRYRTHVEFTRNLDCASPPPTTASDSAVAILPLLQLASHVFCILALLEPTEHRILYRHHHH